MKLKYVTTWLPALVAAILALALQVVAVNAMPAAAKPLQQVSAQPLIAPVQLAPGVNDGGRICQTLRNCRYTPGGSFRGCVSSYSCRTCRYVVSKCSVGASSGQCRRQVCDWGG
jgi:hypothetical protein